MAHRPNTPKFGDSQEAAFRRVVRDAIRSKRAGFTKSERDVFLAIVNQWFHHRRTDGGLFYPGREKIAKRAEVSIRTVADCLKQLRDNSVLIAVANAKGGRGKATRYKLNATALFVFCGCEFPDLFEGGLVEQETVQNCTLSGAQNRPLNRAKIAHGIYNYASTLPGQGLKNVIPLWAAGGAK